MNRMISIVILFSLIMASQVDAVVRYWYNTGGNDLWSNGSNWGDSYTVTPQSGDTAFILNGQLPIGNTHSCQFTSGMTYSVAGVQVQGMGYNGIACMELSGGLLSSGDFIIGSGGPGSGIVTMSNGTLTVSDYVVVGQAGGTGTLMMTDGIINAGNFWVSNLANSKGRVYLNGGTINISGTISIAGQNDGSVGTCSTGNGLIDITGGKIVLTKNEDLRGYIYGWASQGFITAYGGAGTVVAERAPVTGYTTISAIVPAAMTLKGDINKDGVVDMEDLLILARQWLSVPATPSADIAPESGDEIVNFLDFSVLAEDFGNIVGKILPNGNFYLDTPYYNIEISRNPVRVRYVNWDINGNRSYANCIVSDIPGTNWASTLYAGIGGYTTNLAQSAESVTYTRRSGCFEVTLSNILIASNLKADWKFIFYPEYFEHEITWHAETDITGLCNLGHQWITAHLVDGAGDENGARMEMSLALVTMLI